jgi:hypothetical protein
LENWLTPLRKNPGDVMKNEETEIKESIQKATKKMKERIYKFSVGYKEKLSTYVYLYKYFNVKTAIELRVSR